MSNNPKQIISEVLKDLTSGEDGLILLALVINPTKQQQELRLLIFAHCNGGADYSRLTQLVRDTIGSTCAVIVPFCLGILAVMRCFGSSFPACWFDDDFGYMDDRPTLARQRD